jgi:septum formation protein
VCDSVDGEAGAAVNSAALTANRMSSQSLATMASGTRLILASGSPRRIALLRTAGIAFESVDSGIDEVRHPDENVRDYALRMAREKALSVSRSCAAACVLAADTVVECDGEILLKPQGSDDARRMLRTLSGKTHTVVTAFAIARGGNIVEATPVLSQVTFRDLGLDEIDVYISTGEPLDKAGAYGIQGVGASFISHVEGSCDNVMGLPVRIVLDALHRQGVEVPARG